MDLHQVKEVPVVQVLYESTQATNNSPSTSGKRKNKVPSVVDEILSIPTSKRNPIEQLSQSKSSSSDDSLGSFGKTADFKIQQLENDFDALDKKNTEDHLSIFQHIQKDIEERKKNTEFNRQIREDIESLKSKIDNLDTLYKVLNDGLTAAQQSEVLRNQKVLDTQTDSKRTQQQLTETLQKIETNADLYTGVQQQYTELKAQFDELCTRLAQNPASSPLLNKIMSTPRLNSSRTSGNQTSSTTTNEITLEDILTQQQEELLAMGKMIQQLNATSKKELDFQKIIDDLSKKVTAVENRNETIIRRACFFTVGSVAALLTSFWIWLQSHKA